MISSMDETHTDPRILFYMGEPHDHQGEEEQLLDHDTCPEGVTYLGTYASLEQYLRAQLEDQVSDGCQWILDHLDYQAVQKRFEADGSRLFAESGCIYRITPQA